MAETEQLRKKDLELFLEVNKKAIEIDTEVAGQNEEIISLLNDNASAQNNIDAKVEQLNKKIDDISKDLFKIQVLFITGILSLLIQIVQMIIKK
jgi:hypothetical protein